METKGRYLYTGSLAVQYNRLWKLLIDKNMSGYQLCKKANLANGTIAKLRRNETVSMDTMLKICEALQCGFEDVIEVVHPNAKTTL